MTFVSRITSTRRVAPSHQPWNAHAYQRRAVDFLCERGSAALFLDPGLGKTSIVLDAFRRLLEAGVARKALVVAPLRVCQTVWRQEGQKWTEFRDLRFSLLHGGKKADRLKDDADIWLINPEGVPWLAEKFFGRTLPFDTVILDELTKFKNASAKRHKTLRPRLKGVARRWGLTGTPAPNGYMDLFGQMLILDDGAALGRYITHFRDTYFQVDFNGFDYSLQPGGDRRIEAKIKPYVLRMSAEEYLELPPLLDDVRVLELEPAARKTYAQMKKDMLAELPEGVVTGANAAAVYSKLKQMANGAVYVGDQHTVAKLHDTKLEALDDLVEELAGQQLLIAYEFNHDIDRLRAHFGDRLAYIGKGVNEQQTAAIVAAWNKGEIQLLACHPASAGHGLNLQYSSCAHVLWLSPIWDFELYDQFIKRVYRQGNEAQRIINHIFTVRDTIDELALQALRDKDTTQERLLRSLRSEILREAETQGGETPTSETRTMVTKLSRQADAGAEAPRRVIPKGWGNSAAQTDIEDVAPTGQREKIGSLLRRPAAPQEVEEDEVQEQAPAASRARSAFSGAVQSRLAAAEQGEEAEDEAVPFEPDAKAPAPEPEPQTKRASPRTVSALKSHPKGVSEAEAAEAVGIDYDQLGKAVAKYLLQALANAL